MALPRLVVAAATVTLAAAVFTAAPTQAVTTAFTVSGTEVFHPPPYPETLLPGYFAGNTIDQIHYPAAIFGMDSSIAVAVAGLTSAVAHATGPAVVAGFSQGAIAVAYEKQAVMSLPAGQRPAVNQLTFVTIGDPTGPNGILRYLPFPVPLVGLTPFLPPDTPYDSVIVNGEYDGWADFPDRPWNVFSLLNALMGTAYVHGGYEMIAGGLDLATVPARNITVTTNSLGGTTTSYLIPTDKLPLVQPLRDIGIPEPIVVALETPLKALVDAGYARNDTNPVAAQPATTVRASARPAAAGAPARPRAAAKVATSVEQPKRRPAVARAAA